MLQLRTLGLEDTLVARLVRGNMEDIQKHKFQQIARAYAMPLEDIMAAVRIIEALDPRPASKYTVRRRPTLFRMYLSPARTKGIRSS
jgi:RNA polymerase sigma-54 factor